MTLQALLVWTALSWNRRPDPAGVGQQGQSLWALWAPLPSHSAPRPTPVLRDPCPAGAASLHPSKLCLLLLLLFFHKPRCIPGLTQPRDLRGPGQGWVAAAGVGCHFPAPSDQLLKNNHVTSCMKQRNHRIMEHTESEGTPKDHQVQPLLLSSGKEHELGTDHVQQGCRRAEGS